MTIETSLDGVETHQASPNQMLFFKRLYELKKRIKELSSSMDEQRREDIKNELNSILAEFETLLQGDGQ